MAVLNGGGAPADTDPATNGGLIDPRGEPARTRRSGRSPYGPGGLAAFAAAGHAQPVGPRLLLRAILPDEYAAAMIVSTQSFDPRGVYAWEIVAIGKEVPESEGYAVGDVVCVLSAAMDRLSPGALGQRYIAPDYRDVVLRLEGA